MDWEQFCANIAQGNYWAALMSGAPVWNALAAENYGPSSEESRLLRTAASRLQPSLEAMSQALTQQRPCVAKLFAIFLHGEVTREAALERLRELIQRSDEGTLKEVCRVLDDSPPRFTQEFAARLMDLHRGGPGEVRRYALRALGYMKYRGALGLALEALQSGDEEMREAAKVYFSRDPSHEALSGLMEAVRRRPTRSPGWVLAVGLIRKSGLLATGIAQDLLLAVRSPESCPTARASLAICLRGITLDLSIHEEVLEVMKSVLREGIARANEGHTIRGDGYEDSRAPLHEETVGARHLLWELVSEDPLPLHDLLVQALESRDWNLRGAAARVLTEFEESSEQMLRSLVAALADAVEAEAQGPVRICPLATEDLLNLLLSLGAAAAPARSVLERLLREAHPELNDGNLEKAAMILEAIAESE